MGKIYYLIPDLHRKEFKLKPYIKAILEGKGLDYLRTKVFRQHKPIGGIKVHYQHCIMLREMGYDAYPLIMGDYTGNFFGYDIELKYFKDLGYMLNSDDYVVSTELLPYQGLKFKSAKKILFMQNWINIKKRLESDDKLKSYTDLGYDFVITCGQYCSDMVKNQMGIDAITITNGIDQDVFFSKPENRVPGRVLAFSRKNAGDLEKIVSILRDNEVELDINIVDGLTQEELIKEYQKADVFLATGYPEGLPLPPLEAMNCGCAVVGFTGGGAGEYMVNNETALVSDDGDCQGVAKQLEELLVNNHLKEKIRKNGMNKGQEYTLANMKKMLRNFYEESITTNE